MIFKIVYRDVSTSHIKEGLIEDLIEATEFITAEYVDIAHYSNTIGKAESDFDETLEVFHPAKKSCLSLESTTGDD